MKKNLLLLSACIISAFTSYGQEQPTDSSTVGLKAHKGNVATELNVNPFNGSLSLNNSLNQLKFRFFTSPGFAWRLGINGSKTSTVSDNNNPYGTNPYRFKDERSSTTIGLNLGIEKHFTGTKRLSPYTGVDITFAKKSTEQIITEGQTITKITGAWRDYTYNPGNPSQPYIQQSNERGYSRYGVNLFTGFDFYMARHLFFGYELNAGFSKSTYQNIEVTQTYSGGNQPTNPADVKQSSFNFGPNLMNGVRIGYVF